MKKLNPLWKMSACFAAAAVTLLCSLTAVQAAALALNGSLTQRPLTPTEIKTYGITGTNAQFSAGINTIGLGEPAYLDAMVNAAIAPSNIVGVTWVLTNQPAGSGAVLLPSPLGTNVPLYKMADRYNNSGAPVYQLAGRTLLRPDVRGQYTVNATITANTSTNSTPNIVSTNLTITINGSTFLGAQSCLSCHSGHFPEIPNMSTYTNTPHASFFARAIDGLVSDHYSKNCISCHTVGYDTNSFARNGGFDDEAAYDGWTFPAVLTNGNWASMQVSAPDAAAVANIQCENCHGPGYLHATGSGNTNFISVTLAAADCGQCHDSLNTHYKSAEWNNSIHARTTRTPSGPTRAACARCHTPSGFVAYTETLGTTNVWTGTNVANTAYEAITCQACHDPHNDFTPHQLRVAPSITLADGETAVTVTNAGAGTICMNCHQSRTGSYTNSLVLYPQAKPTYPGGSASFGPHDNPAADMIEGINGYTYGKVIPSSAHRLAVTDTCAGCHMQDVASTNAAFLQAGGHTFSMTYTNTSGAVLDNVAVCIQCHGQIDSFDMVKVDYNGDGVIEGVQTEVQRMLNQLSTLLPPSGYKANANDYVADGKVKSPSTQTNWPAKFLQATWNWQLVNNDLSKGVHNAAYATGLLKASIGNLTGDDNNDGIPDAWQIAYFGAGFATNPAASTYAINNTAGVPNWMMAALNQDPTKAFKVAGSGVISVNDGTVLNGDTNNIAIYTAAEIVFNTVPGYTYTIQGISELTSTAGWQNISTNIPGTGTAISYLTPTKGVDQMFYRVVHNP